CALSRTAQAYSSLCTTSITWRPPTSTLFPYTTLFRSCKVQAYRKIFRWHAATARDCAGDDSQTTIIDVGGTCFSTRSIGSQGSNDFDGGIEKRADDPFFDADLYRKNTHLNFSDVSSSYA